LGLEDAGFRVDIDDRDETVSKRIRDAEVQKIPRVIVYGDRETLDALAVRERGGEQSTKSLTELIDQLATL
jgi:threonyl-tRNA synthetase